MTKETYYVTQEQLDLINDLNNKPSYFIVFLDEDREEQYEYSYTKRVHDWKLSAFKQEGITIINSGYIIK